MKIVKNDILPANSKSGEYAQEASTAYKAIKKQCHMQAGSVKDAIKIADKEEAKRDDYLFGADPPMVDWTITNPPFRFAEQFIERANRTSRHGFAVIVRAAFLEGHGRFERLFSVNPPSHVLQFTERVVMHKGRLAPEGSTATAYCWLVWIKGWDEETIFDWIPPCRKRLERASDYEAAA